MQEWDSRLEKEKRAYADQREPEHAGVEATLELLEWLWDSGVSAVVGDAISWEVSDLLFLFPRFFCCLDAAFRQMLIWDGFE